jgi:hypothetical protein
MPNNFTGKISSPTDASKGISLAPAKNLAAIEASVAVDHETVDKITATGVLSPERSH